MQTILYHAKLYVARGDFRSALCAEDGIIRAVGSDAEIPVSYTHLTLPTI